VKATASKQSHRNSIWTGTPGRAARQWRCVCQKCFGWARQWHELRPTQQEAGTKHGNGNYHPHHQQPHSSKQQMYRAEQHRVQQGGCRAVQFAAVALLNTVPLSPEVVQPKHMEHASAAAAQALTRIDGSPLKPIPVASVTRSTIFSFPSSLYFTFTPVCFTPSPSLSS